MRLDAPLSLMLECKCIAPPNLIAYTHVATVACRAPRGGPCRGPIPGNVHLAEGAATTGTPTGGTASRCRYVGSLIEGRSY